MTGHMKAVLILGGTGAMGTHLCKKLDNGEIEVTVTSRKERNSDSPNLKYIRGNAKEISFINNLFTKNRYNVIIDFMNYTTAEFQERYEYFLNVADQYIFISSARVYAESASPLREDSPRLLDVCTDAKYLATDEYALSKARQEDMLITSGKKNFTIVRPSLTYDSNRLQFAISEKEEWLQRALHGRSIVFPKDMENIRTTMAFGGDVANAISKLVGNNKALGETVHITGRTSNTWGEILDIYQSTFREKTGRNMKVYMADDSMKIAKDLGRTYQIKYARRISRTFDCTKLDKIIGKTAFLTAEEGLKKCLEEFLDGPREFKALGVMSQAYFDRLTQEHTGLKDFHGTKEKIKYVIARYTPLLYVKSRFMS